ncbi:MAG: M1 family metallopeptidase [Acidobacteria bacterium]|nr:M1 family metallopeptidase [Acidobacteriota bacterium]
MKRFGWLFVCILLSLQGLAQEPAPQTQPQPQPTSTEQEKPVEAAPTANPVGPETQTPPTSEEIQAEAEQFEPLKPIGPVVDYQIEVSLDVEKKMLRGQLSLVYDNQSPDSLPDLMFHLYMNAFKNERSTYMRESGDGNRFQSELDWGYIDINSLQIAGVDMTPFIEFVQPDGTDPEDQTVMRVPLETPLAAQEKLEIKATFTTKLPRVIARTGFYKDYFLVAQWFPKLGVWETAGQRGRMQAGWNCHQFHANTEFYADYGNYQVSISLPKDYIIGASGSQVRQDEHSDHKTYTFELKNVHDFAFTASPHFLKKERTFDPNTTISGQEYQTYANLFGISQEQLQLKPVKMILLLQPYHANQEERYFQALTYAIKFFGLRYGAYPYETITVVDPPVGARESGGMEYPTFITAGTRQNIPEGNSGPAEVIIHEFGHQYWYGMVGSNEFEESWLDEGFNTYSTGLILDECYAPDANHFSLPPFHFKIDQLLGAKPQDQKAFFRGAVVWDRGRDALVRPGWKYWNRTSYGINSYPKPALILHQLRVLLTPDVFDRAMRHYFQTWQFKHPSSYDFQTTLEQVSGRDLDWFFDAFVYGNKTTDYAVAFVNEDRLENDGGYLETNSGRTFRSNPKLEADSPKTYTSTVRVEQLGTGTYPVPIHIRFADDSEQVEQWEGTYPWHDYVFEGKPRVQSVQIDPDFTLLMDLNRINNYWQRDVNNQASQRLSSKLLLSAQNLLQLIAGGL